VLLVITSTLNVRRIVGAPEPPTPGSEGPPVVDAGVRATVQTREPASTALPVPTPNIVLDEAFAAVPAGWPNQSDGSAWYSGAGYEIQPREAGQFVAIDAPVDDAFHDGTISARLHKTGGPPGGGYGIIVADQGPEPHDGVYQGGQFLVFEAGDQGLVGVWQREGDHWLDVLPWTPSGAVRQGDASNELTVQDSHQELTFSVNGTEVYRLKSRLPAGRVGIFVGGDGNQVAVDHFTIQADHEVGAAAAPARVSETPSPAILLRPAQ
jgi:hypothetical protein